MNVSIVIIKISILSKLQNHLEVVHEGKKYPCDQCTYKAAQKDNLLKHRQSIHEGVKYWCEQCNYEATQLCHL